MTWIYGTATPDPDRRHPGPIWIAPTRGAIGISLRLGNTIRYLAWLRRPRR